MNLIKFSQANLPNLRRLFVEARTEAEESQYSRNAVSLFPHYISWLYAYVVDLVLQHCAVHVICGCFQSHRSTSK